MAYIGKEPIVGNFQVCDAISVVNGQAAYTMQVSSTNVVPESANHMLVSLNGILQKPNSSFTVSGSTITFASNLATGDVIDFIMLLGNVLDIGTPSDSTVTDAKTNFVSTSSASGLQIRGDGTTDGTLQLNCSQNSHGVKIASPAHSAGQSYKLILPTGNVTADTVLKVASVSGSGTTGIGQLSFGTVSSDFVKLASTSGSNVSSIDVNGYFTSDYDRYVVYLEGLYSANDSIDVYMKFNTGSYTTQSSNYNSVLDGGEVNSSNTFSEQKIGDWGGSKIKVGRTTNNSNYRSNSIVTIFNPLQTSYYHSANALCQGWNSTLTFWTFTTAGTWKDTTAVTGLNFSSQSGNIYANNISLYGIKD